MAPARTASSSVSVETYCIAWAIGPPTNAEGASPSRTPRVVPAAPVRCACGCCCACACLLRRGVALTRATTCTCYQVNVASRELNLSDADFSALFGTDKAALAAMPKWKRQAAKKKHGLF